MRRKAEILKYNKNIGGLTKSQKYAKASRGELMRQIGNENKYLSDGVTNSLVCPTVPPLISCGLTTACGVPGKEKVLCYDPSITLYNMKRTYEYKAGLQTTSNIPTTAMTPPKNLTATVTNDGSNIISLSWDAPDYNGGFPITGYVISYSINNKIWDPYTSLLPNGKDFQNINLISGELNGNTAIFKSISGSIEIKPNVIYYISVFSANVRGLSSVPATVTVKTTSVPSIISNLSLYDADRKYLVADIKWTNPTNGGTALGGYNGPIISSYNLYYKESTSTTWTEKLLDVSSVLTDSINPQLKHYVLRNLENQKSYKIKIEPINSIGVGPESTILTVNTLTVPAPPTNINVSALYGKILSLTGVVTTSITTNIAASSNYLLITWDKPTASTDNGGSPIKSYNIIIEYNGASTPTIAYPIPSVSTDTTTTYKAYINKISNNLLAEGTYSVSLTSFNKYFYSTPSPSVKATMLPVSTRSIITSIASFYNSDGLEHIEITFVIPSQSQTTITNITVNGLVQSYSTRVDINGLVILATGEHTIKVPASISGREVIYVGSNFNISLGLTFSTSPTPTTTVSEVFPYTPEISYTES
jgi:hypothetical protein